jgi:hypothetical protein
MQGYVDRNTGIAELEFIAEFVLTAGPLYKARRNRRRCVGGSSMSPHCPRTGR